MAQFEPYVKERETLSEFTLKAVVLGVLLSMILGAANAYLGLKAGMTISATFPAAVIAIAVFRLPFFRGSVLEQNITRTSAAVGEGLVASAVFTIPAFLLANVNGERIWTSFNYWETSFILLIGGVMGSLFIIFLRRTLTVDANLPFPESAACFQLTKAGQKGATGAGLVFGAMGIGAAIELLKNSKGFAIFQECKEHFFHFPASVVHHCNADKVSMGQITHEGGITLISPLASPALMGVGYIIGPRYAAVNFAGGVLAWLVFIPLAFFLNPGLASSLAVNGEPPTPGELTYSIWFNQIRPIAVGAMLVSAVYTLWGLRKSFLVGIKGIFRSGESAERLAPVGRLEKDLNLKWVSLAILVLTIPLITIYYHFTSNIFVALATALIMLVTGFLLSAVGGWLVGLIGSSNQPISGLTLSALVIAALLMLAMHKKGVSGVAAVLGVAAVVCCAVSLAGGLLQDLKIGHFLGGTPWKMELAEIISTIVVAFFLVLPMMILHTGYMSDGGIGGRSLPAPQAGLMAQLSVGIVTGQMPWGLVLMGMGLAIMLIMIDAPSPMLIAVGMYLPFETSFAIFVGGVIKWISDVIANGKKLSNADQEKVYNTGTLVASGLIAGEAIMGVILAGLALRGIESLTQCLTGQKAFAIKGNIGGWLSFIIFAVVAYGLIRLPHAHLKAEAEKAEKT